MDLYTILGLARTASSNEIERAYRRLARRYHPGLNPGDRVAEELYRQVQDAYRVLTDAEQRQQYDHGALAAPVREEVATVAFEGFDFTAPAEGPLAATFSELFADVFQDAAREATTPTRGADLELALHVSFRDAATGTEVPLSITRQERCPACAGAGRVSRAAVACPVCRGQGARRWSRGHMVFTKPCDACDGRGQVTSDACRGCGGVGLALRTEVLTIALPAGIESGTRVAVPGRGHAGALGGPAGDLYVTVDVGEDPVFRRVGRDVYLTVPLAVHEAALGADVDVPTLNGSARLRVPAGTSSGTRLRVRGQGLAAPSGAAGVVPGDLVVDLEITLPSDLDDRSRQLLSEFGRRNGADVRRHLFDG